MEDSEGGQKGESEREICGDNEQGIVGKKYKLDINDLSITLS